MPPQWGRAVIQFNERNERSKTFNHSPTHIGIHWIQQAIAVICLFPVGRFFFRFPFDHFTQANDFERERDLLLYVNHMLAPKREQTKSHRTEPNQANPTQSHMINMKVLKFYNCCKTLGSLKKERKKKKTQNEKLKNLFQLETKRNEWKKTKKFQSHCKSNAFTWMPMISGRNMLNTCASHT